MPGMEQSCGCSLLCGRRLLLILASLGPGSLVCRFGEDSHNLSLFLACFQEREQALVGAEAESATEDANRLGSVRHAAYDKAGNERGMSLVFESKARTRNGGCSLNLWINLSRL